MEGLDLSQRPAAFFGVREGLGFLEGLVAGADGLGEPVLCGFHQRAGISSGATAMALRLALVMESVAVGAAGS